MNRILIEESEISDGVAVFGGARAEHVAKILKCGPGDVVKTGVVNGKSGTSEIISVEENGGEFRVTARTDHREESLGPWIDIILAPPRPRALKRLLPQLAAMGAGRIVLAGAEKTEKDFWGATLLKKENWRPLLIDGLMQAGTTALPEIETRRSLARFVADGSLDAMFPSSLRIVAHPDAAASAAARRGGARPLLAIGPEGGWTDREVEMLENNGFGRFSLGPRILKTETAAIALLAVLEKELRQ